MPKDYDLNFLREQILLAVEGTAYWRHQKADEYPNEMRNQKSAQTLDRLHRALNGLAADEFVAVAPVWFEGGDAAMLRYDSRRRTVRCMRKSPVNRGFLDGCPSWTIIELNASSQGPPSA